MIEKEIRMDNKIADKWLESFAKDVPRLLLNKYVISDCNFLWHIFSFDLVSCLTGEEAERAFNTLVYEQAMIFESGYYFNGEIEISELGMVSKIPSNRIKNKDVYITDTDYKWTYVKTHDSSCGPYFLDLRGIQS